MTHLSVLKSIFTGLRKKLPIQSPTSRSMLIALMVVLLHCIPDRIYGQLTMDHQSRELTPPPTEAYNFVRYGQVGCSLYTGTVNLNVPFYTYKDNDFTLPISFSYASDGYKPNTRPVVLGPGWNLIAGGSIVREVKGIPDESKAFYNIYPNFGVHIHGYQRFYLNSGSSDHDVSRLDLSVSKEDGTIMFYRTIISNEESCELEPDIFHFNFLGYSGSFQMDENGEVKFFGNGKSLQQLKADVTSTELSTITITTEDGYKYLFGHLGIESILSSSSEAPGVSIETPTSWRLHKIIAPNGRTVVFNYNIFQGIYEGNYIIYAPESTKRFNIFSAGTHSSSRSLGVSSTNYRSYPLESIEIDNGPTIRFGYLFTTGEKCYQYHNPQLNQELPSTPRLEDIKVIYGKDTISRCHITYKAVSTGVAPTDNTIYFPKNITIEGEGTYSFNYIAEDTGGFPPYGTHAVDAWGYYNGSSENMARQFLTNGLSYNDTTLTETVGSNYRYSNHTHASKGMLVKVTYPTGGYSEIEYEPHTIGAEVARKYDTRYKPELVSIPASQTGGLRVRSITNYTKGDAAGRTTTYNYTATNGSCSGILLSNPRYGVKYRAKGGSFEGYVEYYSLHDIYQYAGTHIEYSQVTETLPDSSKNIFRYTTWHDYPDKFLQGEPINLPRMVFNENLTIGSLVNYSITTAPDLVMNILTPVVSMQTLRGQLKSQTILDSNNTILSSRTWEITPDVRSYNRRLAILGEYYSRIPNELYAVKQLSSTESFIYSGNHVTSTLLNHYNSRGQISCTRKILSNGEEEVTTYLYPQDSLSNAICATMAEKNMLYYPISVRTYKKASASDSTQNSGTRYTYDLFNDIVRVSKEESYNPHTSQWDTTATYTGYDAQGNLLESTDANGMRTAYIWGYGGLYLIAKIENAFRADINDIVGTTPLGGCLSSGEISSIKSRCPNSNITTYEYKPLVGVSKITHPNGEIITYEYNDTGKLMGIYNSRNEKMEETLYSTDNKQ